MAFNDRLLPKEGAPGYRYWWAHCIWWVASALIWFGLFFLPLYFLGYWAFAFPPWLLVAMIGIPFLQADPGGASSFQLLIPMAAAWVTLAAITFAIGLIRKNIIPISIAIQSVLPPIAIALAYYLAADLNGGNFGS